MLKPLEIAIAAVRESNWSLASQCLQQLSSSTQLNASEQQQAIELAVQVLKGGDFNLRWDVAKVLPKLGKASIATLIEILEDETADLEIRWFVARILSEFREPTCINALVKLLQQTEDEELSLVCSQALANMGVSAIEALEPLLKEPESRLLAVQALAQIRRTDIIEPLLKVVCDPMAEIRAIAIEALGSFHDQRIIPILIEALTDPVAVVRKEAAIALGMRTDLDGQENLVEQLKPLLYDFNPEVCQQTAIALGRLGSDDATQALLAILKSSATPVTLKLTVIRALSWIETPQASICLQEGLHSGEAEICQEIVTVLGRKELPELKKQAAQILIEFFDASAVVVEQPQIKQALAMSLGELGQTDAIDLLLKLAEDNEQIVRLHAIAALKKFPDSPLAFNG